MKMIKYFCIKLNCEGCVDQSKSDCIIYIILAYMHARQEIIYDSEITLQFWIQIPDLRKHDQTCINVYVLKKIAVLM